METRYLIRRLHYTSAGAGATRDKLNDRMSVNGEKTF